LKANGAGDFSNRIGTVQTRTPKLIIASNWAHRQESHRDRGDQ